MELRAAIAALVRTAEGASITLHTDSRYVCDAFNAGWIIKWKGNGWKAANKKPVKNQDLWNQLIPLAEARNINWKWVKGHAGIIGNEEADALANNAALSPDLLIDEMS